MKYFKIYIQWLMLLALVSCIDETLISATYGEDKTNTDMFLRVNVPRTYGTTPAGGATQETLIKSIDVLVFVPGTGGDYDKYYLKSASEGKLVEGSNTFQVTMPVGENLMVHVFANSHEAIVAKGAYKAIGLEMEALLSKIVLEVDNNGTNVESLPMHGFRSSMSITKGDANKTITVPVLRSVAAVQVATKAMIAPDGTLTPGSITDAQGKTIFLLREFYAYFQTQSGRVAPTQDAYVAPGASDANQTRSVKLVSLPLKADVCPLENKLSMISATDVGQLGNLYLYENKHYTDNGFDQPGTVSGVGNEKVATTRLVVGGIYDNQKKADGTPKITYYRVDIADPADQKLTDLLRNHKYLFNITSVGGSGYDTPDEAATGVPINITIQVIDWTDVNNDIDFDRENWFSAKTKKITLPRDVNSVRSINVESDVTFGKSWTLNFQTNNNGTIPPVQITDGATTATIENERYKITLNRTTNTPHTKATLSVMAKVPYNNVPTAPASRDEALVIKVKNLRVVIDITQIDRSPDDWGNGGDQNTGL